MRRALELAYLGLGKVSPNPMVGCVIVYQGKILGEGYHQKFGQAHAEINALNEVQDKALLSQSDVYVSLEPCSHYGKTPPCADRLIAERVKKVIVACQDPNPQVAGKGVAKLLEACIEVEPSVLEAEARWLNRRFFVNQLHRRPWVLLKWAETTDGFIARQDYSSQWISGIWSRKLSHAWRSQEDAVLVGTGTALYDSPRLDVRLWPGRSPLRVILDREGKVPIQASQATTLVLGKTKSACQAIDIQDFSPKTILQVLWEQNIGSVMVEGGAKLLQSFIDANLWDEARVFNSPVWFGKGIAAPCLNDFQVVDVQYNKPDRLTIFENWHSFRK